MIIEKTLEIPFKKILPKLLELRRGGLLEQSYVEAVTGLPYKRLAQKVAKHFYDQGVVVRRSDGIVRLLTDEEQAHHAISRVIKSKRQAARAAWELGGLDKENLSPQTLEALEPVVSQVEKLLVVAGMSALICTRAMRAATQPRPARLAPGDR
jgi:spore germination protein YaaH